VFKEVDMEYDIDESTSPVLRITIDERLEDNLIRVLTTHLKDGLTAFNDDPECWDDEGELLLQKDNYRKTLSLTERNVKAWPWDKLQEGQVFFLGRFQINRSRHAPNVFRVDPRRRRFQRVDWLTRERVKEKYLKALERSTVYVETDQT